MKAMKKMLMFNLVLAAMGSVALADPNMTTVTCLSDQSTGDGFFTDHQAITVTFDENFQNAHVQEYHVSLGMVCGVRVVRHAVLQNTEEAQVQPGCGNMTVQSSLGNLRMLYNLQDGDAATLVAASTSTGLHCFNGAIDGLEDFLNRRN